MEGGGRVLSFAVSFRVFLVFSFGQGFFFLCSWAKGPLRFSWEERAVPGLRFLSGLSGGCFFLAVSFCSRVCFLFARGLRGLQGSSCQQPSHPPPAQPRSQQPIPQPSPQPSPPPASPAQKPAAHPQIQSMVPKKPFGQNSVKTLNNFYKP